MIKQLVPEHRCKKCKTPLEYQHNYVRSGKEIDEIYANIKGRWNRLIFSRLDYSMDTKRQYWKCPKCFEEYLVDLR